LSFIYLLRFSNIHISQSINQSINQSIPHRKQTNRC